MYWYSHSTTLYTTDTGELLPLPVPWELWYLAIFSLVPSGWSCQREILATCSCHSTWSLFSCLQVLWINITYHPQDLVLKYCLETVNRYIEAQYLYLPVFTVEYWNTSTQSPLILYCFSCFSCYLYLFRGLWAAMGCANVKKEYSNRLRVDFVKSHAVWWWANSTKLPLTWDFCLIVPLAVSAWLRG